MKHFNDIWLNTESPLPADLLVKGLSLDTRTLVEGDLFCALNGDNHTALDHLLQAKEAGAVGALIDAKSAPVMADFPVAAVPGLRLQLSQITARFFDHPATGIKVIGVTGTNGKSTICYLTTALLERLGYNAGYCGTFGAGHLSNLADIPLTTPDIIEIWRQLSRFNQLGCSHVAMEVSSHALTQGRVEAVPFQCAVFTNFSRDHLDYHGCMEDYWDSKKRLFQWRDLAYVIVNADDPKSDELCDLTDADRIIRYGFSADADFRFVRIKPDKLGFTATLVAQGKQIPLKLPVFGEFNLLNLLAVCALVVSEGHEPEAVATLLTDLPVVPGRMQSVVHYQRTIIVDFAHNPDALKLILEALRKHCSARLFCVFGCGGDRDSGKRPLMGHIASQHSDAIWLTNDNARSEDAMAILLSIKAGCRGKASVQTIADRRAAIHAALDASKPGDFVLVAGKGHERYQLIGTEKIPLYDADVIADWQPRQVH